jgi:regulatory protein
MDNPKPVKITDVKIALAKAEHFCAYQERAQQDVRNKLYDWGLWPEAVENIIVLLIGDNFLNEERFAKAYVSGKFKQKHWGRIKIRQGLKLKKVPDTLLRKALQIIDADDYMKTLVSILNKKSALLKEKEPYKRRYKLQQYAMSRGFEGDLVNDALSDM